MAKQISRFIERDHGTETFPPGLEPGAPLKLLETYIPRQSRDDESRSEFERFMQWSLARR